MNFISVRITAFKTQCRKKKSPVPKGHSPEAYWHPGNSSRHLYFVYDKFTAELPVMVHSCLIFGWHLALHFPFHWLMVRSVTSLDLFSCYLNINWRQHPTTQMSNILKANYQIRWHHPKTESILSFATSPLKRAQFHTPTEVVRGFRPYQAHPLGLSATSQL